MANMREMMDQLQGVLWQAEGKIYLQPYPLLDEQEPWGGMLYQYVPNEGAAKTLVSSLIIDESVDYILANTYHGYFGDDVLKVFYGEISDLSEEVLVAAMEYIESLTHIEEVSITYGTCELCQTDGGGVQFVMMNDDANTNKVEIKHDWKNGSAEVIKGD